MPGARCYPFSLDDGNISDHRPIYFATARPDQDVWHYYHPTSPNRPHNWVWEDNHEEGFNNRFRANLGYPDGFPSVPALDRFTRPRPLDSIRAYSDGSFQEDEADKQGGATLFSSPSVLPRAIHM